MKFPVAFLMAMLLNPLTSQSQIIRSTDSGGPWYAPATWVGGVVPTPENSSHVIITGSVWIDSIHYHAGAPLQVDWLDMSAGTLQLDEGAALEVNGITAISAPASLTLLGDAEFKDNLSVSGTITASARTTFSGITTITGTGLKIFHDVLVTGTVTPNAVYTITGNLKLLGTGTLLPGANTTFFEGPDIEITNVGTGAAAFNNMTLKEGSQVTTQAVFSTTGLLLISGTLISNAGFYAGNDLTVSVDTGVVIVNNAGLTVGGTFTVSTGAVFTANEGANAVILGNISASGELTIKSLMSINATTALTGGGTKTFHDITIAGSFKPNAPHTVTGNFSLAGSGTLIEGISTTTFAGPDCIFSNTGTGTATFNNILVAADSKLTNRTPLRCNGTFRATGDYLAAADFIVTGTLTVSRSGSFSTPGATALDIGANLTISGSFQATCPSRFSGMTSITGIGSKSFNDIIITGTLTSYAGIITVSGNITNDGVFFHNGGTVVLSSDQPKVIGSTLPQALPMAFNNLTVIGGTAARDLSCEINVKLAGVLNLTTGTGPAMIDVDGSNDDQTFTVLSLDDDPATDGSIGILPSDAIVSGAFTVQRYLSGEGRIYRYIASPMQGSGATVAVWQQSFPITGTFADPSNPGRICNKTVLPQNPSLFYYDEPAKAYVPFPQHNTALDNPLQVGRGYAAFIRRCTDSTLVEVSGSLIDGINRGTIALPVSNTDPVTTYNNLIGNPFPSAIDWDRAVLENVSPTIAIRDNGSGIFHYYTQGGNGATDLPNGAVAQGQSFWVRTTGISPLLTIGEDAKVSSPATAGNTFFRLRQSDVLEISLAEMNGAQSDKAYVVINPMAESSSSLDNFDAPKMNNQRDDPFEERVDLYTTLDRSGFPLAVNAIPKLNCAVPMQLVIRDLVAGNYQLTFSKAGLFSMFAVKIHDAFTGDTLEGVNSGILFSVTADTASQSLHRFELIFSPHAAEIQLLDDRTLFSNYQYGNHWYWEGALLPDTTGSISVKGNGTYRLTVTVGGCETTSTRVFIITGLDEQPDSAWSIYPNPVRNILSIMCRNVTAEEKFTVTDLTGRKVGNIELHRTADRTEGQFNFSGLPAGCYFVVGRRKVLRIVKE